MHLFCVYFERPDKRAPMIRWCTNQQIARRTALSMLNLTLSDYGQQARIASPSIGYKPALQTVIQLTGEDRLMLEVSAHDVTEAQLREAGAAIFDHPTRIVVWERATAENIALRATAPKVRPGSVTGVERFNARRAEAQAGNWKLGRPIKL